MDAVALCYTTGQLPDFEVEYTLDIVKELEGVKPSQGMRCDFLYDGDDPKLDDIHMIWPELLDDTGEVILDKNLQIKSKGFATMWIGMPNSRKEVHCKRLKVGVKGY